MHICATDARQESDRYPNNGLISVCASSTEWEHGAAEVGGVKEESGGGGGGGGGGRGGRGRGRGEGGREYVMHSALPASQPASGTLMTIMSCHTSCRASQQILPLSLPFSNQCH